jgi:putative transposase
MCPGDFLRYKTVYYYFRKWRREWQQLHERLRGMVRVKAGWHPSPSAAMLDRQTRRLSTILSKAVGYDAAKPIKAGKVHLLVDTLGLVMVAVVRAAHVPEQGEARMVFAARSFSASVVDLDGWDFAYWVLQTYHWIVRVVRCLEQTKGFVKLPVRWGVERRFGWLNWCRRKDYEVLPETQDAMVYGAMVRLMVRRLA